MALRIDFEGVSECIDAMNTSIEDLEEAAADINTTVMQNLGEYWEGDSYDKCITTYEDEYQDLLINKIPDMVGQLRQFMETCKQALQETDASLAGK